MIHICQIIPRRVLEKFYKIEIIKPKEGEDPDRPPTALEFLNAYACELSYLFYFDLKESYKEFESNVNIQTAIQCPLITPTSIPLCHFRGFLTGGCNC